MGCLCSSNEIVSICSNVDRNNLSCYISPGRAKIVKGAIEALVDFLDDLDLRVTVESCLGL